ncbi:lipase family protein [Amycolatopsis anabasis]|uniref:lipase family protein n=1 Tax=Amycolatopsis anabasis TaxID=1840409 RepID=UPI00131C5928|nr:lipase family protein [Amycolatopsis anabasis]
MSRSFRQVALLAAVAVSVVTGSAAAPASALPLPPGNSGLPATAPWQVPADGPGTVIGTAPLPVDRWVPGSGDAFNVSYRSTGVGGALVTVSGSVFLPKGAAPAGGWPVVSWAHGTTGLGDGCAPSTAGRSQRTQDYLAAWLGEGYAIVATDYLGLGTPGVHPYLDGRTAAYGVIDMVRAARSIVPALSNRWVVVGQSQGGHATMFTANLATKYAPELDYRGAVATGVPANLQGLVPVVGPAFPPSLLGAEMKSYIAYILAGLRAARPDFDLRPYLTPLGESVLTDAEALCGADMGKRMAEVNLGEMFTKQLGEPFGQAWGAIYTIPTTGYDRPFFIAQGDKDTVAFPFLTKKLIDDLAASGQPCTYRTYPADHGGTMAASLPDTTAFVRPLLAG